MATIYLHLLQPGNLKNNASYEVKTKSFLFECLISAETYAIYKVTWNSRSKSMHRAMNGNYYCTLARNFFRQSQRCTNPNESGNHGGEAWRGKTKLFWSPGTIWPPCEHNNFLDHAIKFSPFQQGVGIIGCAKRFSKKVGSKYYPLPLEKHYRALRVSQTKNNV